MLQPISPVEESVEILLPNGTKRRGKLLRAYGEVWIALSTLDYHVVNGELLPLSRKATGDGEVKE